jgi:hypothetical protein
VFSLRSVRRNERDAGLLLRPVALVAAHALHRADDGHMTARGGGAISLTLHLGIPPSCYQEGSGTIGCLKEAPPVVLEAPRGLATKGLASMRTQSTYVPRFCARCGTLIVKHSPPSDPRTYCSAACFRPSAEERFWAKVRKSDAPDGCWEWIGSPRSKDIPYGCFWVNGRTKSAPRYSWELHYGPIPDGMAVRHFICDNPPCVRPDHLLLGTNEENTGDRTRKGRGVAGDTHPARLHPETRPRGENHPKARLTALQVVDIRARYAAGGVRQVDLAAEFGITQASISALLRGKTWVS